MKSIAYKLLLYLGLLLAMLLVVATCSSFFFQDIYSRENPNWRAQTRGQDLTGLIIIAPLLTVSLLRIFYGKREGYFLFGGTLLFIIYSYAIYCFALHFNSLFLLNCMIFGLSFYLFLFLIIRLRSLAVESWFRNQIPRKATCIILGLCGVAFSLTWLKEIIPALLAHNIPQTITANGLLSNPVYILDLAILLPGMFIAANLLWHKQPLGFVFAPMLLIFADLQAINLAILMIGKSNIGMYLSFLLALFFSYSIRNFLRGLKCAVYTAGYSTEPKQQT